MSKPGLRVEIHKISCYTSTIINGDEFGGQKMCFPGNTPRARLSPYAIARGIDAVRAKMDPEVGNWFRTFRIETFLEQKLSGKLGDQAPVVADAVARTIGIRTDAMKPNDTSLALLTSDYELNSISEIILKAHDEKQPLLVKKKADEAEVADEKKDTESVVSKPEPDKKTSKGNGKKGKSNGAKVEKLVLAKDLAQSIMRMYSDYEHPYLVTRGRFLAGAHEVTRLACRHIAHGFGTTPYQYEADFCNAHDDKTGKIEWMGRSEVSSMIMYCFYMYDVHQAYSRLLPHLGHDQAVAAVISEVIFEMEAFGGSMPLARSRSTAPFSMPSFYLVYVVSGGQPINFSPAYNLPCRDITDTISRADNYAANITDYEVYPNKVQSEDKSSIPNEDKYSLLNRRVLARALHCDKEYLDHVVHLKPENVNRKMLRTNVYDALKLFFDSNKTVPVEVK